MSLAIIRQQNPYRARTAHFLHTQEDKKDCCYKLVVKRVIQSVNYDSPGEIQIQTVATYYARVLSAVQEALEIYQGTRSSNEQSEIENDCFVEVHINEDR